MSLQVYGILEGLGSKLGVAQAGPFGFKEFGMPGRRFSQNRDHTLLLCY